MTSSTPTEVELSSHMELKNLHENVDDFWIPYSRRVDRIPLPTSALAFYRDYVSKSVPVIIQNAISHWNALQSWENPEYLSKKLDDMELTIDVTPNGLGDNVTLTDHNIHRKMFIKPEERTMTMQAFFQIFNDPMFDGVPYLSHQNDNLRSELKVLEDDYDAEILLASEAFGNKPEAINLWIGDQRAISSIHKDHYENIYCVVAGQKKFTLLPPSDVAYLPEDSYVPGRFVHETLMSCSPGDKSYIPFHRDYPSWYIHVEEGDMVPWIPMDPLYPDHEAYPLTRFCHPIECVVNPGETLYLPAMWYHRVTQTCPTISVNYWHDMEFDCKYVYYNYLRDHAQSSRHCK